MKLKASITKIRKSISPKQYLAALAALSVIGFFIPVFAFIGVIAAGVVLLSKLRKLTVVEALVTSFLIYLTSIIALFSVATVSHLHIPIHTATPLLSLLYTALLAYLMFVKNITFAWSWSSRTKSDVVAVLASITILSLFLIPIINQSGSLIARFLSYGEDNASHYTLTRYDYQHGQFTYNQQADTIGVIKSLEIYPQGFHMSSATLISLIKPISVNEAGFIKVYAVGIALFYALFVFWLAKLCTLRRSSSWAISLSLLPAITILCGLSNILLMLDRGFQPQIFAYIFLLALAYLLTVFDQQTKPRAVHAVLLLTLCIGVAASWWFLLLIAGIMLLLFGWRNRLDKDLLAEWKRYIVPILVAAFTVCYPVAVNILLSKKNDPLSEQGGVDKLPWIIFGYILIPAAIGLAYLWRSKQLTASRYVLAGLAGSLFMAGLIGAYHKIHLGYFEYYFYKSFYAVLVFGIALLFISLAPLLEDLFKKLGRRMLRWSLPVILLALTIAISWNTQFIYAQVYINNWFPQAVELTDLDPLFTQTTDQYSDILYTGDCSSASDYLSNRWSGARLFSASYERSKIEQAVFFQKWDKLEQLLPDYSKHESKLLIIIDERCAQHIPYLEQLQSNQTLTVVRTHQDEAGKGTQ